MPGKLFCGSGNKFITFIQLCYQIRIDRCFCTTFNVVWGRRWSCQGHHWIIFTVECCCRRDCVVVVNLQVDVLTRPQLLLLTVVDQNVRITFCPIYPMGSIFLSYLILARGLWCVSYKLQSYWLNYQRFSG